MVPRTEPNSSAGVLHLRCSEPPVSQGRTALGSESVRDPGVRSMEETEKPECSGPWDFLSTSVVFQLQRQPVSFSRDGLNTKTGVDDRVDHSDGHSTTDCAVLFNSQGGEIKMHLFYVNADSFSARGPLRRKASELITSTDAPARKRQRVIIPGGTQPTGTSGTCVNHHGNRDSERRPSSILEIRTVEVGDEVDATPTETTRTKSSWPQSDSFASTPSTTPSQCIDSTPITTPSTTPSQSIESTPSIPESQQSLTLNCINYEAVEQPVASSQDPDRSYGIQPEINQSDQDISSRLRLRHRDDDDVQGLLHSTSPPQALLVPESLFRITKVYFENSCRNMSFDKHETLLNPNGTKLNNDLCANFDSYCFTATMLIGRKLHVEFGHALSKASALVKQILQAEHPRTLPCFLEVFIHLIQTGLPDVATVLRSFIKQMSAKVIRKGQPWAEICLLLEELGSEPLDEALARIWECTIDTFGSRLGTSNRLAVSVRLDYIKRVRSLKYIHPARRD
jgi:hypothetical protein